MKLITALTTTTLDGIDPASESGILNDLGHTSILWLDQRSREAYYDFIDDL